MLREFIKTNQKSTANSDAEAFDYDKFYLRSKLSIKYFNTLGWPTYGGCTQYDLGDNHFSKTI